MMRIHVALALVFALVVVLGAAGCAGTEATAPVSSAGAWSAGQTSIAYLPAPGSVPQTTIVTASAAGGPPAEAALQGIRPGEVWCKVVRPATYDERSEQVLMCGPRWEWRRTTECDVPGTDAAQAASTDDPRQARPGQTWCYVKVPPVYETRTTRTLVCPERVEWRRTTECDVPPTQ